MRYMGNPANFVVVERDGWQLHYTRWAATTIHRWLTLGPDAALEFARAHERVARDAWLNDVYAEGGFVVDTVARRLVWFDKEVDLELPVRRVVSRLIAEMWPGWRIDWAYDGIGDLAAYVGVDRAAVRALDLERLGATPWSPFLVERLVLSGDADPPKAYDGAYQLVTARLAGGVRAWVADHDGHLAWLGPAVLDRLPMPGSGRLRLAALPDAGLHLDVPNQELAIWTGGICPGLAAALEQRWPRWTVTFWRDRFERQVAAAGGAVDVPACDERSALSWLATSLFDGSGWQGANPLRLFEDLAAVVKPDRAALSEAASQHGDQEPREVDLRRLAQAVTRVTADLAQSGTRS